MSLETLWRRQVTGHWRGLKCGGTAAPTSPSRKTDVATAQVHREVPSATAKGESSPSERLKFSRPWAAGGQPVTRPSSPPTLRLLDVECVFETHMTNDAVDAARAICPRGPHGYRSSPRRWRSRSRRCWPPVRPLARAQCPPTAVGGPLDRARSSHLPSAPVALAGPGPVDGTRWPAPGRWSALASRPAHAPLAPSGPADSRRRWSHGRGGEPAGSALASFHSSTVHRDMDAGPCPGPGHRIRVLAGPAVQRRPRVRHRSGGRRSGSGHLRRQPARGAPAWAGAHHTGANRSMHGAGSGFGRSPSAEGPPDLDRLGQRLRSSASGDGGSQRRHGGITR